MIFEYPTKYNFEDPIKYNLNIYSNIINDIFIEKKTIDKTTIKLNHKESQQIHRSIISNYLKNIEKNLRKINKIPKKKKLTIIEIYILILKLLDNKSNKFLVNLNSKNYDNSVNRFKLRRKMINSIINEIKFVMVKYQLLKRKKPNSRITKIKMLKTLDEYLIFIVNE